jgi:lipid II:glycine glycyltransferase (peptidoglycan interpeptide bridge formation enzyme)
VLSNEGHPLQLWGWGQLKAAHGWSADRIFAYEEEKVIGAAQVLIRKLPFPFRSFAYVPRGPIVEEGREAEFLTALAEYVKREHKSLALSIEPDTETFHVDNTWVPSQNRILPSSTIILDLKQPESQLLALMAKKTRQYIRKSAAEAIQIRQVRTKEALQQCLAIYHDTAKRAEFNLHSDQYYLDVFNSLQDHSVIYAAYHDDRPIAFLWVAVSEHTAFELYGGMNDQGQLLRANYSLKWHVIRKTKEWGLSRYDFGGLINDGVSNFKRSWSDQETNLAGTFDKPLQARLYDLWSKGLPMAKTVVHKLRRHR